MTTQSRENWRKIGAFLQDRRATDLGYRQRTSWTRDKARNRFGARVIIDLEGGVRDTYSDDTIAIAEDAYRLAPGSLRRALDTGEPPETLPLDDDPAGAEQAAAWRVLETPVGRITAEITRDLEALDDLTGGERSEIEAMLAAQIRASYTALIEAKRTAKNRQQGLNDA